MERLKKIETHAHASPVSICATLSPDRLVARYKECGFDAMILTNHYSRAYIEKYDADPKDWLDRYIEGYHEVKREGENVGLDVWLGAEVTLYSYYVQYVLDRFDAETIAANYADYMLIGVTEKFLRSAPMLCDMSVEELRQITAAEGILLVQAHPYRVEQRHSPKDPKFLDGYEINGNIGYPSGPHVEETLALARDNGLVVTCGGDTHHDWQKLVSAIFVPEEIGNQIEFAEYLKKVRVPAWSITEKDDLAAPRPEPAAK